MDGATLRCGAVAVVKDVKNPISLARAVMERTDHVLLVGPGASAFAREVGLARPRQRAPRHPAAAGPLGGGPAGRRADRGPAPSARSPATRAGHLAAATSTGGMSMKRPGRVGDTPIVGCGTYADDALAAVSCTGHGERIIQLTLARHAADLVGARGLRDGGRARGRRAARPPGGRRGRAHRGRAAGRGRASRTTRRR